MDRKLFLSLVEEATARFGIEVIAFALMKNHYHLFMYSPEGQLSSTMQFIGRSYTQAFNSHHERDGALFRGRFRSILVDSDSYFDRVTRYIELNPVDAGVCSLEDLSTYQWSSFRYSAGRQTPPAWLSTWRVQRFFGSSEAYGRAVRSMAFDSELSSARSSYQSGQTVLGSAEFIAAVGSAHPEFADQLPLPSDGLRSHQIEAVLLDLTGASPADLFENSRPLQPVRRAAILLVHAFTGERCNDLARRYGFTSDKAFLNAVRRERAVASHGEVGWLVQAVGERLCVSMTRRV